MISPASSEAPRDRLFGLDAEKLLSVLEEEKSPMPRIPGWTITGIAGRGGFGIVWRGHRDSDGVLAAIKVAPATEPDLIERLEEEIGVLRALRHPHIVRLLDSGIADDIEGGLYLCMEFVDGHELHHEIPAHGFPPETAYRKFVDVCDAVAYAHANGVIHRDLKPSNILVDAEGHIKVADFGLAMPVHKRVHQFSLTMAGVIAGTPEYLPPEAYLPGYQPTETTDVYALGVILYDMLMGTPPRGAWQTVSSLRRVDVRMDPLIRRALEPDPSARWPTVAAMRQAFDAITQSAPRFSGTPLLSFPVRVIDLCWSLLGLWALVAAFSSFLRLRKSSFSLPFDLIGKHSDLIGGYHAVFVLLFPAFFLGIWQMIRLWRFRRVPMREALPSPGGLRLGHGRHAAVMVALCQICCLWLPFLLTLIIFVDSCTHWLTPADPAWKRALAVVSWTDNAITSPWTYPGFEGRFWLIDSYGPPGHPLARQVDRIGFTPLAFPLLMTLGALSVGFAMGSTVLIAIRNWAQRRLPLRATVMLAVCLTTAWTLSAPALAFLRPIPAEELMKQDGSWIDNHMSLHMQDFSRFLLGERESIKPRRPARHWTECYAAQVEYRDHGMISREEVERRALRDLPEFSRRDTQVLQIGVTWDAQSGAFALMARAIQSFDGPVTQGRGHFDETTLFLEGFIHTDGTTIIHKETIHRNRLHATEVKPISHEMAMAWAMQLSTACREQRPEAAQKDLDSLFLALPISTEYKANGWIRTVPSADSGLIAQIRDELEFHGPEDLVITRTHAGGRTRILLRLRNGRDVSSRWLTADLIPHDGSCRCVKLFLTALR